ncbi:hypothetical protein J3Q64DRAFT_1767621 [Phycomyces blakesleeanus]|uniref:Uncharacterized protein n=1 Tax=Phycomyces blakesleeanus TaxID=4837 RepID=A0ABR3AQF8_PHYBL
MLKIPENKPPALRIDTTLGARTSQKTHVPPEELAHFDHYNYRPIFISIEEAVEMWKPVLNAMNDIPELKNYTANAPKSIKHLVLVEADESLHSRLTWTTVTHCMDNDTGIQDMYLEALHCKREKSEIAVIPSMLRITTDEPTEEKKYFSASTANPPVHQVPSPVQSPASVKPSSAGFGFSFSKLLPRLSTTSLPKSPASPQLSFPQQHPLNQSCLSQPCTPKASFDRQHIKAASSISTASTHGRSNSASNLGSNNSRNLHTPPKRSSTIATDWLSSDDNSFLSQLNQSKVATHSNMNPHRPQSNSMDILDFTDSVPVNSPTRPFFSSLTPLVPMKPSKNTQEQPDKNVQHRHTMPTELLSLWNSPSLSVSPKQTYPTSPTSSIILSPVHMDNTSNRGSLVGSPTQINSIKSMDQFLSDKPVQTETTKPPRPILPLEDFWSNKPLQPSKSPAETRSTMPIQSLIPVDDFWAIESTQPIRTTQEINKNQPSLMDDFWSNDFIQPTKQTQPTEHSYPVPSMQPFQTTHNAIIHKKETSLNNTAYNVMTHKAVQNRTLQSGTKASETKIDFEFGDFLAAPLETNASDDFGDFASSSQHDDWPSTWEVADTSTTASKQPVKEEDEWGEWATFK